MTNLIIRPEPTAEDIIFQTQIEQYRGSHYNGWPLAEITDPFLKINLERTFKTLKGAIDQYGEVIAFRIDLTTAKDFQSGPEYFDSLVIDSFFAILRRLLRERQKQLPHYEPMNDSAQLDYIWRGNNAPPGYPRTYYTLLIMNRHAYYGHHDSGDDLCQLKHQICNAWATANRTSPERAVRLLQCPRGIPMLTSKNEPESPQRLFKEASLLCRTTRHDLGIGVKLFGSSR